MTMARRNVSLLNLMQVRNLRETVTLVTHDPFFLRKTKEVGQSKQKKKIGCEESVTAVTLTPKKLHCKQLGSDAGRDDVPHSDGKRGTN